MKKSKIIVVLSVLILAAIAIGICFCSVREIFYEEDLVIEDIVLFNSETREETINPEALDQSALLSVIKELKISKVPGNHTSSVPINRYEIRMIRSTNEEWCLYINKQGDSYAQCMNESNHTYRIRNKGMFEELEDILNSK